MQAGQQEDTRRPARRGRGLGLGLALVGVLVGVAGCTGKGTAPALNKSTGEVPKVPVPPADGPKLGAIADEVPVYDRPAQDGKRLGYLHAGARVVRAAEPFSKDGCPGGWYPVRPRGFVCAGDGATTDLTHPTLVAMSILPKLDQPMPWVYARTLRDTPIYQRAKGAKAVEVDGKIESKSGMAIVGSWKALDPQGKEQDLGLLTNGKFVKAKDLRAAEPSAFAGVDLNRDMELPIAFVLKRGVRLWELEKATAKKRDRLQTRQHIQLTGRFRSRRGVRYWATRDGFWVRHQDVTIARRRSKFPDFATGKQRWIDYSIITGILIAYEGKNAVFTTLASAGRDRLAEEEGAQVTKQGDFEVLAKHVTAVGFDPKKPARGVSVFDVPWTLELSSGQRIHGAYWYGRFGVEHGPGDVLLSPKDAKRLFDFATPGLPEGWHGVQRLAADEAKTIVRIRK